MRIIPFHLKDQQHRSYINRFVASEISALARYSDRLLQCAGSDTEAEPLLGLIDCPRKDRINSIEELPDCSAESDALLLLLNGTFNYEPDIQHTLQCIKPKLNRRSRILVVAYNSYLQLAYVLAQKLGIAKGCAPAAFLTFAAVANLARLAGYEIVRKRFTIYCPWRLWGLGSIINRWLPAAPGLRRFSLAAVVVLRPLIPAKEAPSLSIIIPARNERGNIESALTRLPEFGGAVEVIFVEGHSKDGTWEEIQRLIPNHTHRFKIEACQQQGIGKCDAVRLGFSKASNDLLVILDGDLTVPPELLLHFYNAYVQGLADFINGDRLTYPFEKGAMRFLNRLGNVFFAKAVGWVIDAPIGDSLCGTKVISRLDYQRLTRWIAAEFADCDPFGDFELLFGAANLGLGIIDVPIRYRDRAYGSTQIHRWSHGLMLARTTWLGLRKLKLGRV